MENIRASAFHARTAAANRTNGWVTCNGVTLPTAYGNVADEALCARTRVGVSDLGGRRQLQIDGRRAVEFLQRLLTRDVATLAPSTCAKALWLSDGGGVRGAGAIARLGTESFWLISASCDLSWIASTAAMFDVDVRDISATQAGLAVIGHYSRLTLENAGIEADLESLALRKLSWRGIEITLSRMGEYKGYEIWCDSDDAIVVWDRIARAGAGFGIAPVGATALDVLDVEAGVPRPQRDYSPAQSDVAGEPVPLAFALDLLVDADHFSFNGRRAVLTLQAREKRRLVGLEICSERPAPFVPVLLDGRSVGRTLSSVYSPALRRAIALAQLDETAARPGTSAIVTLATDLEHPDSGPLEAGVCALPFLPFSEPLAP